MLTEAGDWTRYRNLPDSVEVDFHVTGPREVDYWEAMGAAQQKAMDALRAAHRMGLQYVIFTHGHSTSGPGQTTARSMIRGLIRSRASTPFVVKARSIQHNAVLVAAIKTNPAPHRPVLICPTCGGTLSRQIPIAGRFKCSRCRSLKDWFDLARVTDPPAPHDDPA